MASEIEDFFIDHKLSIEERQYIISLLQASALANLTMRMLKSSIPKMKVGIVELRPTNMYRHSDN
ncbi:MAG: hypothetical protein GWP10_18645 [Nitrospiraceae bacterium]|nr:hypothetical protein [Nitrospiraceae bacterium]